MAIENKQQATAFLEATCKGEHDGLPGTAAPIGDVTMALMLVNRMADVEKWIRKRDSAIAEQARGAIEIRLGRTGNSIGFYLDGKHVFSPTPRNLALILDNIERIRDFQSKSQVFYYREVPAYTFRGKLQEAKPAAVVACEPGKLPVLLATGAAADKLAEDRKLAPVKQSEAAE